MKRKLLSVLLTLCLAFSLLPTAALADGVDNCTTENCGHVAAIGTTHYSTLQEAVNAANNGETVTLLGDVTLTDTLTINKSVTIDGAKDGMSGKNGEGCFTVTASASRDRAFNLDEKTASSSTVNFKNIRVVGPMGAVGNTRGISAYKTQSVVLNLENAYVSASCYAVNIASENTDLILNVKNSRLEGWCAFQLWSPAKVNVTGSELIGTNQYTPDNVYSFATIVVNQCSVASKIIVTNSIIKAISHESKNTPQEILSIQNINNTGSQAYPSGNEIAFTDCTVSAEGSWKEDDKTFDLKPMYTAVGNNTIGINGKNFFVPAYGEEVSDELIATAEIVRDDKTVTYGSVLNAISDVKDGETVTLLKDAESAETLQIGKSITLDLGDYTFSHTGTGNTARAIYINADADVTIKANEAGGVKADTIALQVNAGGKLTIQGGTYDAAYVLASFSSATKVAYTTIVDGVFNGWVYTNGTGHDDHITINGGTYNDMLYLASGDRSTYVINDGTFNTSLEIDAGKLDIMGGTFKASVDTTNNVNKPATNNNGSGAYVGIIVICKPDGTSANGYIGNAVVNIKGGTFENTFANGETIVVADFGKEGSDIGDAKVIISDDAKVKGKIALYTSENNTDASFTVTGGYFTSDPTAYLAADHYVWASDKDGYAYMVKNTAPTSPEQKITVIDKTDATVSDTIKLEDKTKIEEVKDKANVDGVAEAVSTTVKTDIVNDAKNKADNVPGGEVTSTEIEVKVNVSVTEANLSEGSMTFKAEPVANVKVNGTELRNSENNPVEIPVSNAMLNGKPITVKLPLPTVDGKLFTPKQIKHTSSDGSVEYFLDTQKTGAKTFEIKDDCAVFKITKFSTFELSGKVTYVAPSYSGGSSDPTYSVSTPSKTEHGTVTVSPKSASKGDTVTVTVKPDSGYVLETLTVTDKNGNELTLKDKGNGKYTFTMPAGKVEVKATFMEDNSMLNFFYDVPNNAYFYEAVKWAVENGITTGVGNDLFAPEQPCTRAQIVTFLWRAAGSPEPKGAASGMTDVVSGSYYEKAVAWAIENGITTGTTTSTFSPDVTCTRAQAVTFLARALKAKAASAAEFSDVPTGSYFADAVAWAAANGVTEGIGGGLFGSDNDCTRGQIVTFLYRAYNK